MLHIRISLSITYFTHTTRSSMNYLPVTLKPIIPLIAPSTIAHSIYISQEHVKNIAKSWRASVRKTNTHPTVQDIQKYLRSPTQTVPGLPGNPTPVLPLHVHKSTTESDSHHLSPPKRRANEIGDCRNSVHSVPTGNDEIHYPHPLQPARGYLT